MNRIAKQSARTLSLSLLRATFVMFVAATSVLLPEIVGQSASTSATARAIELDRAGQTAEAVRSLQDFLSAHPADLEARLALADIYARNGEGDKAEQEFREALRLHPGSSSAETALAGFYIRSGSLSAAEAVLEDAVRQHPKLTEPRAQLALVLAREHKYREAEAEIRLVPAPADPNARVRYFRLVASIHSGLGDARSAAHAIEEALHVTPADPELQLIASIAEAESGEWKACIRNVAPLYKDQPSPESGLLLLRAQLATQADFKATLESLRALSLPDERKLDLRIRSAEILASAERHAEAVEELQQAVTMAGGQDATLIHNLAVEQYSSAQFDDAFATLAPLQAQSDSAEIENLLGDIEEQRGNTSAAVHNHQNAIAMAPGEERYRLSLGAELLQYRAYDPAVTVFQQAAELFPNSARIYVGLGMAYYFLEKYDDSVSAFLRADKLDGDSGRAISYLGATQVENAAGPAPNAVDAICDRAASHITDSTAVTWCGALLFRKAYLADNQSAAPDVIRRLRVATKLAPGDPVANCSLGHALEWTEQLAEARHWLEICVRQRPESVEDHYRLSRVYQGLGLKQAAAEQANLTVAANTEQDQGQAMTMKFAKEMSGQTKIAAHPKQDP